MSSLYVITVIRKLEGVKSFCDTFFGIMLKYIATVVLIVGASLYVSVQYKEHANDPTTQSQQPIDKPLASHTTKSPKAM
jgi:hypothetical protein